MRADRRIYKTRNQITSAFLSLCEKKDFAAVVVRDITDEADVSRSTFYAHFQDKYDLLEQFIKDKLAETLQLYTRNKAAILAYEPHHEIPDPYFVALFEYLSDNTRFYRVMLFEMPEARFGERWTEAIRQTIALRLDSTRTDSDHHQPIPHDILLGSMACCIAGTAINWLKQGMMYAPNDMAIQLSRVASIGFYQAMSVMEYK